MSNKDAALPARAELIDGLTICKDVEVFPPSQENPNGDICVLVSECRIAKVESPRKEAWGGLRLIPQNRGGQTVNVTFQDTKSVQDLMDACGQILADFASTKASNKP